MLCPWGVRNPCWGSKSPHLIDAVCWFPLKFRVGPRDTETHLFHSDELTTKAQAVWLLPPRFPPPEGTGRFRQEPLLPGTLQMLCR